ncbi:formate transporter FocA [Dermabacteraceae bacterium P13264]|nr:formate transporter FocA [Dermabacteraceae bacterium TAE3-ERU5]
MEDLATKVTAPAPPAMAKTMEDGLYAKATKPFLDMFLLALTGGGFIALGFIYYVTSQQGMTGVPTGFAKVLGGMTFSVGLVLVIISGSDLFTGTTLTVMPRMSGRITTAQMLKHWAVSYFGNLIGSLILAVLILLAGVYKSNKGAWGLVVMNVSNAKIHHTWLECVFLGLLANFAVCLAVWMAVSGRNTMDKVIAIMLPISLFVASGFEHSIANMFMLPMGLMIKAFGGDAFWTSDAVKAAGKTIADYDGLTIGSAIWNNIIPVTIGNIIGGAIFVGVYFWVVYRRNNYKNA